MFKKSMMQTQKQLSLIALVIVACLTTLAQEPAVFHITEVGETLTTDIPGALITSGTPVNLSPESWTISLAPGWSFFLAAYGVGEPENGSQANELFLGNQANQAYWYSEVNAVGPFPSSFTAPGLVVEPSGISHDVVLSDVVGVPDNANTGLLILLSIGILFGTAQYDGLKRIIIGS